MLMSPLQILISVTIYLSVISAEERYVTVECVDKCTVTGGRINVGDGDNITLKYVINTTNFITFRLEYESTDIIQIVAHSKKLYKKKARPSFIDLSNTTLMRTTRGFSFSFKVIDLNKTIHDGKTFKYVLSFGDRDEKDSSKINVQYGPKLLEKWKTSYEVQENENVDVNVTLSGNPQPEVTARMEKEIFKVSPSGGPSSYTYNVKLKHVQRSKCGRNLILKAVGYRNVSYTAKLNVNFIPSTPKVSSATVTPENCLVVLWKKIESGTCVVKYTILYTYNEGRNNTKGTTYELQYKHCFDNVNTLFNGTVRVQAEVGGRNGSFSEPKQVVVLPPTVSPPTTTTITTTPATTVTTTKTPTSSPKTSQTPTGSSTVITHNPTTARPYVIQSVSRTKWYYILLLLFMVAAFILLMIVIFLTFIRRGRISCCTCCVCCRTCLKYPKGGKQQTNPNPSPNSNGIYIAEYAPHSVENEAMEGDYGSVQSIGQPRPEPVQEMDYAELGPGGRIGEKPLAETSIYAQVNTDEAYYPSLKQGEPPDTQEPEYDVSIEEKGPPSIQEPEYAASTKVEDLPSTQEEPEHAVSSKAIHGYVV